MNNVDDEITSPNNDSAIRNFIISRKMKKGMFVNKKTVSARIVIHYTVVPWYISILPLRVKHVNIFV